MNVFRDSWCCFLSFLFLSAIVSCRYNERAPIQYSEVNIHVEIPEGAEDEVSGFFVAEGVPLPDSNVDRLTPMDEGEWSYEGEK